MLENIITSHSVTKDYEGFRLDILKSFAVELPFSAEEFANSNAETLYMKLSGLVMKTYEDRKERLRIQSWPVIKNIYENQGQQFTNLAIPFSADGEHVFQIGVNLKKAYESQGKEIGNALEKSIVLFNIDDAWREHLREMDDLRGNVQNASIEQKDPLLIYKFESFNLFKSMVNKLNYEIGSFLFKAEIMQNQGAPVREAARVEAPDKGLKAQHESAESPMGEPTPKKQEPIRVEPKAGRNDPCPCGSGKKYKQCHGKMETV